MTGILQRTWASRSVIMTSNFRPESQSRRLLLQDAARLEDVELKHQRIARFLESAGADALLLQDPANIAWATAGTDLSRFSGDDPAVNSTSLFITPEARLFATNSVDSAQIFEREAFGLGFQLKQREWFQPHEALIGDLCRGRRVLADRGVPRAILSGVEIRRLRTPLTGLEVERLRMLSRVAVHAVESTAHHLRAGVTESEVAGEVSHRLLKRTVAAARIQVCADGRNERYRHWTFGETPIREFAVISCCARRWGLHVGVTRTVCLQRVPQTLWQAYQQAVMIHATGLFFTRHGERLGEIWKKVHRIFEKFGMGSEWQLADQGDVIGYSLREAQIKPDSDEVLETPSVAFWHPSVGPALLGDSMLCRESANELLTTSPSWPQLSITVKGREVQCPGILLLPGDSSTSSMSMVADHMNEDFKCPEALDEDAPSPVESVWEMRVPENVAT
ncbi:MAG: M24 family metallopeptidase [Planctomycetaceae bacterium]